MRVRSSYAIIVGVCCVAVVVWYVKVTISGGKWGLEVEGKLVSATKEDSNQTVTVTTTTKKKPENDEESHPLPPQTRPRRPDFILGLSTGHSGSTTYDSVIRDITTTKDWDCPLWVSTALTGHFEWTIKGEEKQIYTGEEHSCEYTNKVLIPQLEQRRGKSGTYIDLGHFHNLLPNGLECLAAGLGERLAFIHIQRNRYDIAYSFLESNKITPCHFVETQRPGISYCPHSIDVVAGGSHGPTALPVKDDEVWDSLTPFQKFLWLADEMVLRSDQLKQDYPQVQFYESRTGAWSTSAELMEGIHEVKTSMGCTTTSKSKNKLGGAEIPNKRKHSKHKRKSRNCTQYLLEDLDYRKLIGMTEEQHNIIFAQQQKQRIGGPECIEASKQLEQVLLKQGEVLEDWDI